MTTKQSGKVAGKVAKIAKIPTAPKAPEHKVVEATKYINSNLKNSVQPWCAHSLDQCRYQAKDQDQDQKDRKCLYRHGPPKTLNIACQKCKKVSYRSEALSHCNDCYNAFKAYKQSLLEDVECGACNKGFTRKIGTRFIYCRTCMETAKPEYDQLRSEVESKLHTCPTCETNPLTVLQRVYYESEDSESGELYSCLSEECVQCYKSRNLQQKEERKIMKDNKVKEYQDGVNEKCSKLRQAKTERQTLIDSLPEVYCSESGCHNLTKYSEDGGEDGYSIGYKMCKECYQLHKETVIQGPCKKCGYKHPPSGYCRQRRH